MLSNKLTFSLASLVVLLLLAFIVTPAMSQAPTATIAQKGTVTRSGTATLTFTITFSSPVTGLEAADIDLRLIERSGDLAGSDVTPDGTITPATGPWSSVEVTFTADITTARAARIQIAAGAVQDASSFADNTLVSDSFALPAILGVGTDETAVTITSEDTEIAQTITVTLDFNTVEDPAADPVVNTEPATPPVAADIVVEVTGSTAAAVVAAPTTPVDGDASKYSFVITLPFGATAAKISLHPGYIAATAISVPAEEEVVEEEIPGVTEVELTLDEDDVAYGNYIVVANAAAMADISPSASNDNYSVFSLGGIDLEDFFLFGGGTIELMGPEGSVAKDIVISEIMWGANQLADAGSAERRASQWIELYVAAGDTTAKDVTTATPAKAGDWMLTLTRGKLVMTAGTVDSMSNYGLGRWSVTGGDYGQGGNAAQRADSTTGQVAVAAVPYVSMYRNINHTDLVKTDKTRADQLKAIPDGTRSASWKEDEVNRGTYQDGLRYATPGEAHVTGVIDEGAQELARDGVVFNEIANRTTDVNDWLELYNSGTASVKINGWELSVVTDNTTDTELLEFKSDEDVVIPGGGYLLVVNTDPTETSLAAGQNVDEPETAPQGVDSMYYVSDGLKIPKVGLLVLRNGNDKIGTHEKIVDVAAIGNGYYGLVDKDFNTAVWPLKGTEAGAIDDNTENDDVTWVRDQGKALFHGDAWKNGDAPSKVTWVGIDRNADAYNSGTPGYANNAVKGEFADADGKAVYTGMITVSEVMVDQTGRNLPQWIELYNNSRTEAVNINGWELKVLNVNSADLDSRANWTIKIDGDLIIAPSQTALIVSGAGRRSQDNIPASSVYNLHAKHRSDIEMSSQRDSVLSTEGFYISLSDARDAQADVAGNIDGSARTMDDPAWALPSDSEVRSSIIRVYEEGLAEDGMIAEGWVLASMTNLVSQTYYGDADDMASPGNRQGSPLPVSLSSFRPVRDQATGAVVIRWSTESELNNAGFNILRNETKNGEFKVVNTKGIIPGHGTTSEKHTYEWTDTTAKPNVVYYYQIEDVSLDGQRTRLTQTHLRGNVNAAGKATTTWADLKSQK